MKIGILSDTHGWLDKRILYFLKDCDEVWHAGDVGSTDIIDTLTTFKPTIGVYGNIDSSGVRAIFPEFQHIVRENISVVITHIAGSPRYYTKPLLLKLQKTLPDILVCGHSHILKIMRDKYHHNMLYINPGAAGRHGFHKKRTIVRLEINQGKIKHMEAVELGKRSIL